MPNDTNQLPGFFSSIWGYFTNHEISVTEKILLTGLTLLYFVSPIDVIPDVIPILGVVDDVSLGAIVAAFCSWRNRCVLKQKNDDTPDALETEREPAPPPLHTHDDAPIYDAEIVHHNDNGSPFTTKESTGSSSADDDFFTKKKD